jgi:hypothetical protein
MGQETAGRRDYSELVDIRSPVANHVLAKRAARKRKKRVDPKFSLQAKMLQFLRAGSLTWIRDYFRSRTGPKHPFLTYEGTGDSGVYPMRQAQHTHDSIKLSIVADWATGTDESDRIARMMERSNPDYTIHLGDTYYVGNPQETINNYFQDVQWAHGSQGSFALCGNHEMYSQGHGYFDFLLPKLGITNGVDHKMLGQKASYFALRNDHWLILGLDTAYNSENHPFLQYFVNAKCAFPDEVMAWLRDVVKLSAETKRGIVVLTHHQYHSSFEDEFMLPAAQLGELLGTKRPIMWIWGHEHRMAVYGKYQKGNGVLAYGRCIGHGGMPIDLTIKPKPDAQENFVAWDDRLNHNLMDRAKLVKRPLGYNGFCTMLLDGDEMEIEYKDINHVTTMKERWKASGDGTIKGISISSDTLLHVADGKRIGEAIS